MIIRLQGQKPSREESQRELSLVKEERNITIGDYFLNRIEDVAVVGVSLAYATFANFPTFATVVGTAIGAKALYDSFSGCGSDFRTASREIRFLEKELNSGGRIKNGNTK